MAKAVVSPTQFLQPRWLLVGALIALLSYATPDAVDMLQSGVAPPASALKPYPDLRSFRSRYQADHQDEMSVTLHVVGTSFVVLFLLMHPKLIGSGVLALKCGQVAFALFRHHDSGLVEALVMLAVFLLTTRFLGGSMSSAMLVTFVGYFFAWTGHFFYEGNRPATFIYPTHSLICDFIMWAEIVTGASIAL